MDPDLKLVLDAWRKEVVERDRLQQLCYELLGQLQAYRMREELQETSKAVKAMAREQDEVFRKPARGDRCED